MCLLSRYVLSGERLKFLTEVIGLALVTRGVALIYLPAAWILAGVLIAAAIEVRG